MNQNIQKGGRPQHYEHICECGKDYINANSLACHKRDAKSGKTKCTAIQQKTKQNSAQSVILAKTKPMIELNMSRFNIVKQNEDIELGFNDSDGDVAGKEPSQFIKQKVAYLNAVTNAPGEIPKLSSSSSLKLKTTTTSLAAFEEQKLFLKQYRQWGDAEGVIQGCSFSQLPDSVDDIYAQCFLTQAAELELGSNQHRHELFVPSLATIIKSFDLSKVPLAILERFSPFLAYYQVLDCHTDSDLHQLFKLAEIVKGSTAWIAEATSYTVVVAQDTSVSLYVKYIEVVRLFMAQHKLYSWPYITYMRSELTDTGLLRLPNTECFLKLLNHSNVTTPSDWIRLSKQFYSLKGGDLTQITAAGEEILQEFQLNAAVLLNYIEVGLKGGVKVLIKQLKQGKDPRTIEQLIGMHKLQLEEEQLNVAHLQQQQKQEAEKQQYEIELEMKQSEQQQLKVQQEQQKQIDLLNIYHQLCDVNKIEPNDKFFFQFVEQINIIAAEIQKEPRLEQLVTMYLLLNSCKHRTLIQLCTGFGKSFMLGVMARYLNLFRNKKVVVTVPNEVLAANQQQKYAPWASKVGDELFVDSVAIHYCTYEDFLTGNIPINSVLLVDEIDSLFFSDKPVLVGNRVLSAILLLNKYNVIGVTATFRGDQGRNKILAFLQDSHTISGYDRSERLLQLDVYGNLKVNEVDIKVTEVAKAKQKQLPVIIILPTIKKCQRTQKCLEHCFIFGIGRVAAQMGTLELIAAQFDPHPIVLTTAQACLGQDLTPTGYVIQTEIPESYSTFIQNAGRSNRVDPSASFAGALITTEPILTIEAVKQGCEYEQQRQNFFKPDYLQSLEILEACAAIDSALPTFTNAFTLFQNGVSAAKLKTALSKAPRFKAAIVDVLTFDSKQPQLDFKIPLPLGKRLNSNVVITQKSGPIDKFFSPMKRQKVEEENKCDFCGSRDPARIAQCITCSGITPGALAAFEQQKVDNGDTASRTESQILFGESPQKKREQKEQEKLETQSMKSGDSKLSRYSKRSVKKEGVIIYESQWEKLEEQDKYRNALYRCTNRGCSYKTKKGDRWKHVCQHKP